MFVLLVALVVLGPKRLAETSRSIGRALREFREYKDEFKEGLLGTSDENEPEEKRSGRERPDNANDKEKKG